MPAIKLGMRILWGFCSMHGLYVVLQYTVLWNDKYVAFAAFAKFALYLLMTSLITLGYFSLKCIRHQKMVSILLIIFYYLFCAGFILCLKLQKDNVEAASDANHKIKGNQLHPHVINFAALNLFCIFGAIFRPGWYYIVCITSLFFMGATAFI
jgi:hypothetical protein